MSQPLDQYHDRRAEGRRLAAYAFWFHPVGGAGRASAWMLNESAGGAAFLTAVQDAPAVGQRLRLTEMHSPDETVREEHRPLPAFARVVRREDEEGVTRRVAVRFEADAPADLGAMRASRFAAACGDPGVMPVAPPLPPGGHGHPRSPAMAEAAG